jgi:hypothetical protein
MSAQEAAKKHKCSVGLIKIIEEEWRSRDLSPEEVCTCCGHRAKAPGNHFLCEICFKYTEDEEADDNPLAGYKMPECNWDDLVNN